MIVKGAVGVLVTLSSSSSDVLTLQHIASALLRLSNDHSSRARLLQEGAMVAVCNVATACHAVTTTSSNSHSSASSDATALRYITRVCATALNILARADTSTTSSSRPAPLQVGAVAQLLLKSNSRVEASRQACISAIVTLLHSTDAATLTSTVLTLSTISA
eukprot:7418-Heterococcus_DN1.PRE.1